MDRPRFDAVESAAHRLFGAPPAWRFFVPGRIEVFGKHTDYAGGRSLVAATPRGFAVAASPADDDRVVVVDGNSDEMCEFELSGDGELPGGWHRYVAATIVRLRRNFPDARLSTRIAFTSALPPAAGLSSSSALVVAIAESLIVRSGIERSDRWLSSIRTPEDRVTYLSCIENGASFGTLAGDSGVGTAGGSEDHAAILLSVAGELRQFSFRPLRLERVVRMPEGWTFVVASTGVSARKSAEARDDYNRLAATAGELESVWRVRHSGDPRSLGELARAGELAGFDAPPHLGARLEQFIAEDARVAAAAEAFARGDLATVGRLAEQSQHDAEQRLGNQVPETIALAALARSNGAAAASAFGAGWGGSVWALVESADAESWLEEWLQAYRSGYPHHPSGGFVSPPSQGLRTMPTVFHPPPSRRK